ncbi:MAG: Rrf2 family transcriptional regulator [Chloroflexota bacterium]
MKYSKATNYALHTMLYFMVLPSDENIAVQELADFQKLSPTYLSKILTKLVKAGLIGSTPGIKGGYRLLKDKAEVSFLDVIQAIEGTAGMFHCETNHAHKGCLIQKVMNDAEHQMAEYLQQQKLFDLVSQIDSVHTLSRQAEKQSAPI